MNISAYKMYTHRGLAVILAQSRDEHASSDARTHDDVAIFGR